MHLVVRAVIYCMCADAYLANVYHLRRGLFILPDYAVPRRSSDVCSGRVRRRIKVSSVSKRRGPLRRSLTSSAALRSAPLYLSRPVTPIYRPAQNTRHPSRSGSGIGHGSYRQRPPATERHFNSPQREPVHILKDTNPKAGVSRCISIVQRFALSRFSRFSQAI